MSYIFEISTLQFVEFDKFRGKTKMPKFGTKMPYLGIFDQKCMISVFLGWNLKTILSYLKSAPSNLSNCKVLHKKKCLSFGPKMPDLGIVDWNLKTIFSYLKSPPSNLSDCKVFRKNKNA